MFGRTPQSRQTEFICIAFALFPTNEEKSESAGKWQFEKCRAYMGVSKNRGGPPKWMVKIMENLIKRDDLGGVLPPLFLVQHLPGYPC